MNSNPKVPPLILDIIGIMIIEGCITCGICVAGFLLIIDFPDKADGFLNPTEKAFIIERINADRGDAEQDEINLAKVGHHLKDWKLYAWSFLIFSAVVPGFSYNFFTPLILSQGMGFSRQQSLLLTAPPFVCAALLTFLSSLVSDKFKLRGPILVFHQTMTITGMFITAYVKNPGARYFGVFLGKILVPRFIWTYISNTMHRSWYGPVLPDGDSGVAGQQHQIHLQARGGIRDRPDWVRHRRHGFRRRFQDFRGSSLPGKAA